MTSVDDDDWLRPIDLMIDSYAPEQIAIELTERHRLYLREARRIVIGGLALDGRALEDGIRSETRRYLATRPWLAAAALEPAVSAVEETTLSSLRSLLTSRPVTTSPHTPHPVRRLALQPAATMVGNMVVRKKRTAAGVELSWDGAPGVVEWALRISTRPDPRRDYVDGEPVTLLPTTRAFEVALDEVPRRIQIYGHARDGRIVRRAVISALTSGNSGTQWKRQGTAS